MIRSQQVTEHIAISPYLMIMLFSLLSLHKRLNEAWTGGRIPSCQTIYGIQREG